MSDVVQDYLTEIQREQQISGEMSALEMLICLNAEALASTHFQEDSRFSYLRELFLRRKMLQERMQFQVKRTSEAFRVSMEGEHFNQQEALDVH